MCVREDVEFYRQCLTGDSCRSLGDQNAETVKSGLTRLEVGASLKRERDHRPFPLQSGGELDYTVVVS